MNCREIQRLLSALADGEEEASTADQVNAHVERCAVCTSARERLAAVDRLMRGALTAPSHAPSIHEAVARRLPRWLIVVRGWRRPIPDWRGWVPIALMGMVVLWGVSELNAVSLDWEVASTRSRLQQAVQALQGYRMAFGRYPPRVESLLKAARNPRYDKRLRTQWVGAPAKDGWQRPWGYVTSRDGRKYFLYSFGKNGVDDRGDGDDIIIGM